MMGVQILIFLHTPRTYICNRIQIVVGCQKISFFGTRFFIHADRLGISSRFSVYIINSLCGLYLITHLGVYQKTVGLMIYNTLC